MPNYEGQLYGKVKKRYLELQATTEDFDKLNDKIEDLTAQLQKAKQDKEKMIALLKIAQQDYFMEGNKHQYKEVTECLTQCGITHIIH